MRLLIFLVLGFAVGFVMLPLAEIQVQIGKNVLDVNIACCEASLELSYALSWFGALFLGPLLGVLSAATWYWRESKFWAARLCALAGAFLGGALPFWIALGSWSDAEYREASNGAWLVLISVSLPLAWASMLLLFGVCARASRP